LPPDGDTDGSAANALFKRNRVVEMKLGVAKLAHDEVPFLGLTPASNGNIAMSVRIEGPSEYVDGEPPMTKATLNRAMLNNLATACAAVALATAMVPAMAQETGRTRVGTLTCNISPGVGMIVGGQRQLSCIYASARGSAREAYEGAVSTLGLDIGATSGGQLAWAVFAPTTLRQAALAGTYTGATAGGTVGAGASANVLVGGSDRTVIMQPVSVQAQTGVNIAAGVSTLELRPATAPVRRRAQ
jgi:hypothetical protein